MNKNKTDVLAKSLYESEPIDITPFSIANNYYRKILMRKAISIIKLTGVPSHMDYDYILYTLLTYGHIAFISIKEYGWIPSECNLIGYNIYKRPNKVIITNPIYGTVERNIIDNDCSLVYLSYMGGINSIISMYSQKLASLDAGIDVNIINTRTPWIFECDGEQQEVTAKKFYDDVTAGRPVVFKRTSNYQMIEQKNGGLNITFLDPNKTFITDKLLDAKRSVMNEFLTLIGINNSPIDKKERVNTKEVDSNNMELENSIADWRINLNLGFEDLYKKSGIKIEVEFPYISSHMQTHNEVDI